MVPISKYINILFHYPLKNDQILKEGTNDNIEGVHHLVEVKFLQCTIYDFFNNKKREIH